MTFLYPKISFRIFIFGLLVLSANVDLLAQKPEVIYYSDLEERLENTGDTLYVVNFWATWCRPCVAEMPYFDALEEKFGRDKVKVLFVSLDFVEELDSKVVGLLERRPVKAEVVLLDEPKYNTWLDKVSPEWTGALPATLFVRYGDALRMLHEGDYSETELISKIETFVNDYDYN